MMKVGLATSLGLSPSPAATPFASTVFPAPSSPQSARTSPGRARRASRSPIRSVCKLEWLTRSSRSSLDFLESAGRKDEPDGKAWERTQERRPDEHPDVARQGTEWVWRRRGSAAERGHQRHAPGENTSV